MADCPALSEELTDALEAAESNVTRWTVLLWTWLTPRLNELNSRTRKLRVIRADVVAERAELPDFADTLSALCSAGDPLELAATTLARIERSLPGSPTSIFAGPVKGIDGRSYYVAPWQPWLVKAYWRDDERSGDEPPAADYRPSMAELVPTFTVVQAELDGVALVDVDDAAQPAVDVARAIARVRSDFERVASGGSAEPEQKARLVVHLATLGPNEGDGLKEEPERAVFVYGDPDDDEVRQRIEAAVADAVVSAAAERADILVLPELSVPVGSLEHLRCTLAETENAPTLTVAGLRHLDVVTAGEPATVGGVTLSRFANEAVVLAADGVELFRHRKLTSFAMTTDRTYEEDTRLGAELQILRTAIGNLAIVTCLDAFAATAKRLEASYASLVLVPSLSTTISPHRVALVNAVRLLWGSAFVCNRHPATEDDAAWLGEKVQSFWTIALLNESRPAAPLRDGRPTLAFELAKEFPGSQQLSSRVEEDADSED